MNDNLQDLSSDLHARWVRVDGVLTCSNCGAKALFKTTNRGADYVRHQSNHCPCCGLPMIKEGDNGKSV